MKLLGTCVDGFLLPVPKSRLEEYRKLAEQDAAIWMEHGALQYTECAADERLKATCPVSQGIFDCKRMSFGGFNRIVAR